MNDTRCTACGKTLITRFGLHSEPIALDAQGRCTQCGCPSPINHLPAQNFESPGTFHHEKRDLKHRLTIRWSEQLSSVHILRTGNRNTDDELRIRSLGVERSRQQRLVSGLDRFLITRSHQHEQGVVISWDSDSDYRPLELLDRAHYPTGHETGSPLHYSHRS